MDRITEYYYLRREHEKQRKNARACKEAFGSDYTPVSILTWNGDVSTELLPKGYDVDMLMTTIMIHNFDGEM